jgi:hypothetical protein
MVVVRRRINNETGTCLGSVDRGPGILQMKLEQQLQLALAALLPFANMHRPMPFDDGAPQPAGTPFCSPNEVACVRGCPHDDHHTFITSADFANAFAVIQAFYIPKENNLQ